MKLVGGGFPTAEPRFASDLTAAGAIRSPLISMLQHRAALRPLQFGAIRIANDTHSF